MGAQHFVIIRAEDEPLFYGFPYFLLTEPSIKLYSFCFVARKVYKTKKLCHEIFGIWVAFEVGFATPQTKGPC